MCECEVVNALLNIIPVVHVGTATGVYCIVFEYLYSAPQQPMTAELFNSLFNPLLVLLWCLTKRVSKCGQRTVGQRFSTGGSRPPRGSLSKMFHQAEASISVFKPD